MKINLRGMELAIGRNKKPPLQEMGGTGTQIWSGQLFAEDYNPDLQGDKAISTYNTMRKSDGQVKAGLLACTLPIRSATWEIKPASERGQDQKIAAFIEDNLFKGMSITFNDFLSHVLLMLPFGHSVFEKVYKLGDDRLIHWKKLAPRLPQSITSWYMDNEGGLKGIGQSVYSDNTYKQIEIPISKLLVFTMEREGSDYKGQSILRAAYKHWYMKNQLYKIDAIAAERHGVGLAVFKVPPIITAAEESRVEAIGERLHAHQKSYVAIPESYDFQLKGVAGSLHPTMRSIDHHDLQIVRSILAQFINLGAGDVGSYALSQDQSGFFLMALRAVADNIRDTINRYAIPQLVDFNWKTTKYPELVVSGLDVPNVKEYAESVAKLVQFGILSPSDDVEDRLRGMLRLPPSKHDTPRKPVGNAGNKPNNGGQPPPETSEATPELKEFKPARDRVGEEKFVNFSEMAGEIDLSSEALFKAAKSVQSKQIEKIVEVALRYVEKREADKIADLNIPYRSEMTSEIRKVLLRIYRYGRKESELEYQRQRLGEIVQLQDLPIENDEDAERFINARALAVTAILAAKLKAAMSHQALAQIRSGVVDQTAMANTLTSLSDKELGVIAHGSITESLNFGRKVSADEHKDEIKRVVYSALMDSGTCAACAPIDGREFIYGSAEYNEFMPPYKNCEGGDKCRCIYIYVYSEGD